MKKTAKSIVVIMMMLMMLFALTGCGNKVVATKDESGDSIFGNHKETVEVKFKSKKADKVTVTMEFENEENAKSTENLLNKALTVTDASDVKIEREDKKVISTMNAKEFFGKEDLSKDEVKEYLEKEDYKVK